MKSRSKKWSLCAIGLLFFFPGRLLSQGLDPAIIANPPADSWPTYHGDYTGRRHSRLTQITPENVHQLTVAWTFQGAGGGIKASPILVNGVIYLTMPDNIWAIDARSGRQIWRYTYPPNQAFHIGHRGAVKLGGGTHPSSSKRTGCDIKKMPRSLL